MMFTALVIYALGLGFAVFCGCIAGAYALALYSVNFRMMPEEERRKEAR